MNDNYFKVLNNVSVNDHTETKKTGGVDLTYLSWPFAYQVIGELHPDAIIDVKSHPMLDDNYQAIVAAGEPVMVPYLRTPIGYFVDVSVTINGVVRSQQFPVMDHKNKSFLDPKEKLKLFENFTPPPPKWPNEKKMTTEEYKVCAFHRSYSDKPGAPTSFDINTSIQRATVKCFSLHGLGLYIYAGEDLPVGDIVVDATAVADKVETLIHEIGAFTSSASLLAWYKALPANEKLMVKEEVGNKGRALKEKEAKSDESTN